MIAAKDIYMSEEERMVPKQLRFVILIALLFGEPIVDRASP